MPAVSKKRQLPSGLALFLCLAIAGCTGDLPAEVAATGPAPAAAQALCRRDVGALTPQRVARVVDGDTLHLAGGDRLRLVGVNTPEMGADGAPDEPLAAAARAHLAGRLPSGSAIYLQPGEDGRDRYGRRLAYAYSAAGASLSADLIARGLGFHVAIAPNTALADCLQAVEDAAREAGRGIWGESRYAPRPVAELEHRQRGFALVRDRVSRVSFKDNGWWLQLGGKLGLKIGREDQHLYDRRQLQALEGRLVEARGWLVPMDGDWWLMTLGHPSMLEVDFPR